MGGAREDMESDEHPGLARADHDFWRQCGARSGSGRPRALLSRASQRFGRAENDRHVVDAEFDGDDRQEDGGGRRDRSDHAPFTVYRIDTWEPIGLVGLRDISHFDSVAEFGITLHRNHLGQGFGTETAKLVLAYGFQMLNLHTVFLTTDGSNIRGQRAYQKAGFREVGRFREHCIVDRERYDLICMDCLASEFVMPEPLRWGPPE